MYDGTSASALYVLGVIDVSHTAAMIETCAGAQVLTIKRPYRGEDSNDLEIYPGQYAARLEDGSITVIDHETFRALFEIEHFEGLDLVAQHTAKVIDAKFEVVR